MPSLCEILQGLYLFYCSRLDAVLEGTVTNEASMEIKKQYQDVFDFILDEIDYADSKQPLCVDYDRKDDTDLWNP